MWPGCRALWSGPLPGVAPEEWAALGLGLPALGELLAATAQGVNDICEAFDSYP